MTIKQLKEKIKTLDDDMEVVVFFDGDILGINMKNVIVIEDIRENPVLEFGCGWK